MEYKMFVSTFGFPVMHIQGAEAVEVGAAGRENFLYQWKDNTGINISEENPHYGELTGLYWVWKNHRYESGDIVGFCHYNKTLLISPERAERFLSSGYDFIVCRHQAIPQYRWQNELLILKDILREKYPVIYCGFLELYREDGSSGKCNAKNTFITTGREMNLYCTFLFDVLSECRRRIGDVPERKIKRYNALFAERLLSAYILAMQKKYKEADIRYDRWWMTASKMLVNRLPFSGNNKLLAGLRRVAERSSWHR